MEMPKPGEAHRKLSVLIGEWEGDETLHPSPWDPAGGAARARVTNRWTADGFALVQDYEQIRNGQVTFSGHGVFWYDPAHDEYVMHWWDSMGGAAGQYRGKLEGNRLTLGSPMPQGGHARTSWAITGPDAHNFLMEVSPDGSSWQPAMEGHYKRRAARAKAAKSKKKAPARAARGGATGSRSKARKAVGRATRKAAAPRKARAAKTRRGSSRRNR